MGDSSKKDLGMDRCITRRDFLNGAALAIGATLVPAQGLFGQDVPTSWAQEPFLGKGITQNDPRYYPPALTGMRGSHRAPSNRPMRVAMGSLFLALR